MMNTLLTSEEALEIIHRHYSLGKVDYCMFIRRGFNDTYLVDTGSDKYIFRLYLHGKYYVESDDAYRFELDLVEHLHTRDVPVATGIPTENGEYLGVMQTAHGQRAFALFHYADGMPLNRGSVTTEQGYQLGVALANLHLAANSFESQFERYKLDLKYLLDEPLRLISEGEKCAEPRESIKHGRQVIEMLQPIEPYIDRIRSIGTDGDKFGVIHADLHLGNVHFRGNELTIFDFDHCAYGWRAYDLAISSFLPRAQQVSMIEGYESRRPLSQEERDSLTDLGNLRNLWNVGDELATENLRAE
jgi:Ser/Thr protein kinase RdoA (MazF antagonist)